MKEDKYLTLYVRKNDLDFLPTKKITVTVQGTTYNILIPMTLNNKSDAYHKKKAVDMILCPKGK
jgi:hypothetical protein